MGKVKYVVLVRTMSISKLIKAGLVSSYLIPGCCGEVIIARHGVNKTTLKKIAKGLK